MFGRFNVENEQIFGLPSGSWRLVFGFGYHILWVCTPHDNVSHIAQNAAMIAMSSIQAPAVSPLCHRSTPGVVEEHIVA